MEVKHMRKVMYNIKNVLKGEAKSITCDVVDYETGSHVTSKL